jgi:hypothetical protein
VIFAKFLKKAFLFFLLIITQVYGQETIIPLTKGGWVGGLSGNVSWDKNSSNATNELYKEYYHSDYSSETDGFGFSISSKNGQFVINNLSVGFDFQWTESESTTPSGLHEHYKKNRLGFLGLWSRYYIPFIGTSWAMFSEVSIGYGNYKSITDEPGYDMDLLNEITAGGLIYNIGFGATMFVSNNVALEVTGRYQGGTLKGDFYKTGFLFDDYEIKLSNIDILFGIMIYLK